jgi:hypothetical protein
MSDVQDPDKPPTPKPGDPAMVIVESLLKHDVDSAEFLRAMAMAGPSETAEALRQIRQAKNWAIEILLETVERLDELERRFPGIAEAAEED